MEQYKLFVETSERLVARRQVVNTFFLSVNALAPVRVGVDREGGRRCRVVAAAGPSPSIHLYAYAFRDTFRAVRDNTPT